MIGTNFSELGYLRVAAIPFEPTIAEPTKNAAAILEQISNLQKEKVSIALFPELCLSGYTAEDLFLSDGLLAACREGLATLVSKSSVPLLVVGTPWLMRDGRLINCAAVISENRLLGLIPKSFLPNYQEFYEKRWFSPGGEINEVENDPIFGTFPVRTDILFDLSGTLIAAEICEDLWAPTPPSSRASIAGAHVILNLSASNELVNKARYRRDLVRMASAKNIGAYVYCSSNVSESTKDIVFGGHCLIAECGEITAESARLSESPEALMTDLDINKIKHDRRQNKTFFENPVKRFSLRTCQAACPPIEKLNRIVSKHPFVPKDSIELNERAFEILDIQSSGLARRVLASNSKCLVIGISGGLDSTLAFIVSIMATRKLEKTNDFIYPVTMPGPGTTERTKNNAIELGELFGVKPEIISIDSAVEAHLSSLRHEIGNDTVYENAQARERTKLLFNLANKMDGIVVGTGDLSELALGWCTFNADHISGYNVNVGVPKTLVKFIISCYADSVARENPAISETLRDVLDTPISPELLKNDGDQINQETEAIVGPYELHDFFLFHFVRNGSTPTRIFQLCRIAFSNIYTELEILKWMKVFFQRFMGQQFKRTTLPPGPKIGTVSLSPRGDWRMPDEVDSDEIIREIDQLAEV